MIHSFIHSFGPSSSVSFAPFRPLTVFTRIRGSGEREREGGRERERERSMRAVRAVCVGAKECNGESVERHAR
jgi:hypothetical protein